MMTNIEVVKAYFKYCVDGKDVERVSEFFSEDVVNHRPDCPAPLVGLEVFKKGLRDNVTDLYDSIVTTFQKEIVDGDQVVVALTHVARGSNTWKGFNVEGKDVTWTSLTYFRFNNEGKVVEEIVERNELHMSHQLGLVLSDKH
ncbi:ester cyclase [Citrobacter enshiensis]|uniref:ester cyclase n=1 Tax=Citrobacter enshiensis TaxID=2971264 RepID=UPI0023E77668|nr:ester cyclase [Citrobacter enshiensis]WET39358.1 ester cyclase [Citrobacter enshiensis]